MSAGESTVNALRAALKVSPDNVPLRTHLAATLYDLGRYGEAEAEYRHALNLAPADRELRVGLAGAYYQQGKNSHALVIVEELIKAPDAPAATFVLYARLLLAAGDERQAASMYRRALGINAAAADAELAERLGIEVESESSRFEDQLVDEQGRLRPRGDPAFPTDAS